MTSFYPVCLDLRGRPCVVIGGGSTAEAKIIGLLEAGARVTVVSQEVGHSLSALEAQGRIRVLRRPYQRGDLKGAWLAIAACQDRFLNQQVWQEAEELWVLLNAVDDMPHSSFIAPAIRRHGDLIIAVSTAGKSPALAARLRDRIASLVGPEYGTFVDLLGGFRAEVIARVPDPEARAALWYRIVDSDAVELIRRGDVEAARRRVAQMVEEAEGVGAPAAGSGSHDGR